MPLILAAQQAPVNLGLAGDFVALSKTGITNVPPSPIVGNIGASPITGAAVHVTCAEVTGTITVVDAAGPAPCSVIDPLGLTVAINNMQTAYTDAAGRTTPDFTELYAGNLSGKTLVPGLYKWSTGILVDSTGFTLSGGPNAVWIFQVAGDVTLANSAHVTLAGGARANNIFWQVAGPTGVTLGTGTTFSGTILSAKQVIMNTGSALNGRALAQTQITLQSTSVTTPGVLVGGLPVLVGPTVTSTVPANLSVGVPVGNVVTATFSETMNPATLTALTFTLKAGLSLVAGTVSYPGGLTATFTPGAPLSPGTLYTATVTTGAKDPAGVALGADYSWNFTTASVAVPTPTAPAVTSTVPAGGSANVPTGNALTATFSTAMDPATINTLTFTLKQGGVPVAGTVTYIGFIATFRPAATLAGNSVFVATVTAGAKDLAGNPLPADYSWNFTTGIVPDTTPPLVTSTAPANGATLVTITSNLSATFSEPMDPLTVTAATFTLRQGSNQISGTVTYLGTTASFRPSVNLLPNTVYDAAINNNARDLAGNPLSNYAWSFTTGTSTGQTPVCLSNFAVLAGSAVISNGSSVITGDIGVSPGTSITGFPPGTVKGTVHAADAAAAQAMLDLSAGYADAAARSAGPVAITGDIGGQTFSAGLYRSASSIDISSGQVVLDGKGDANAVFIFQAATTLNTTVGRQIMLVGGASPSNVFWQVGTSANLAASTAFKGTILADQSITVGAGSIVDGRLLARNGTITLQANVITSPAPAIVVGGIFNAASASRTVAAGSIAAAFGTNLASRVVAAKDYPLLTLGGTTMQAGSLAAPLFMVSCSQVNLQIPWEAAGQATVLVSTTAGGQTSAPEPATLATFAPGIFSTNQAGFGQGAVEIAPTAQLAAASDASGNHPVKKGEYIAIFGTGLGPVSNQPATGAPALAVPLSSTLTLPIVSIGGTPALVTFSGLVPGLTGLYQVNALVPDATPSGASVSLVISIGGVTSNTVTIAVQ